MRMENDNGTYTVYDANNLPVATGMNQFAAERFIAMSEFCDGIPNKSIRQAIGQGKTVRTILLDVIDGTEAVLDEFIGDEEDPDYVYQRSRIVDDTLFQKLMVYLRFPIKD